VARTGPSGDAGSFLDGPVDQARFDRPIGIAIGPGVEVIVADTYNHRIRQIKNGQVSTIAGTGTAGHLDNVALSAQFNTPTAVAVSASGTIYVSDAGNRRIRAISSGMVTTIAGTGDYGFLDRGALNAKFTNVAGLTLDKNNACGAL
jgi:hypothetical protein